MIQQILICRSRIVNLDASSANQINVLNYFKDFFDAIIRGTQTSSAAYADLKKRVSAVYAHDGPEKQSEVVKAFETLQSFVDRESTINGVCPFDLLLNIKQEDIDMIE